MTDSPATWQLLGAVAEFLRQTAVPQLKGREAFLARVAANAVDIAQRERLQGPGAERAELEALNTLLTADHSCLVEARRDACMAIREGRLRAETEGLLNAFEAMAVRRVRIEQPAYASLQRATAE